MPAGVCVCVCDDEPCTDALFPIRFLNDRLTEIKILKFFLVPGFRHFLTSVVLMVSKHQPSLPQPLTF